MALNRKQKNLVEKITNELKTAAAEIPKPKRAPTLRRQARVRDAKPAQFIAYDFETTNIKAGTPQPLYLTAFGSDFQFSGALSNMRQLRDYLVHRFLTPENAGKKFVGWNANNFDAYFVAAALLDCPDFVVRPYLTKNNSLRGMRVLRREDIDAPPQFADGWEFVDGMAMLGMVGVSLEKFLDKFAPDFAKLTGVIDFKAGEVFDPANPLHCEYAMRDSEGLYHAMNRAQSILLDAFNQPLTVTIGNACIKIFKAHIPRGVDIKTLPETALEITRRFVMRGGFCFCVRRYDGPVWKFDLNQAYAAAMRDALLPAGAVSHTSNGLNRYARVYLARITATNPRNKIPFYHRMADENGRLKSVFSLTQINDVWLTSIEVEQLKAEKWTITVHESYTFESFFNMREFVDKLEVLRMNAEGGPSGPAGTMIKAVGNNAYGKLASEAPGIKLVLSQEQPPGHELYDPDSNDELMRHVWFTFEDPRPKDYEQPQVSAFITAHVRMVVRRAALLAPDAWLYADTDCVVFSEDVTDRLPTDPKKYGAWKIEEQGTRFRIIAKKVYQNVETGSCHAKGLNVKKLSADDFARWYDGTPPVQTQVQRNNFVNVMQGADMYRNQTRKGTKI